MEFFGYFGRFKRKKEFVAKTDVAQTKNKMLRSRVDESLYKKVDELSKQLSQSQSKVIRDILYNFFLDKEAIEWQKEATEL